MTLISFQKEIEGCTGRRLDIRINDNRATMLSVRWEPDCTRVSMHRMFLEAPRSVMHKLACYIRREEETVAPAVKAYIEEGLRRLDYSHQIKSKLSTQGNVYNLKKLYDAVNKKYFKGKVDLEITWFGKPRSRFKTIVTFGLYYEPLKLIKINRILDSISVPDYVVSYVIYHEMLHYACPTYVDEAGVHRTHNKNFKNRETEYRYYDLAKEWIREHRSSLFGV